MALAAFSVNASAVPIGITGMHDDLIGQTTLSNSGAGNEEAWIESIIGMDVTYSKFNGATSGGGNWESVSGVGSSIGDYAFDFGITVNPVYFLVKVGGGGGAGASDTHFLYENFDSLQWAFINLADFGSGVSLSNIGIISHVGTVPGTVPAPGPLAILAIGLVVVGVRQLKKAS